MAINKNFVVKNGLEVDGDLLFANSDTNKVGIGSTDPQYDLHVIGGLYAETIYVDNNISAGGTTGAVGSLLRVGSNGIEWSPQPASRVTQTYTASAGETVFNFVHTVGLIDVFLNGVKLSASVDFIDNPTNITLIAPAFEGDNIELVGYTIFGVGAGVSGIAGITVLDEGVITGNVASIDSINFVGSDITAVGTGAGVTVFLNPSRWAENNTGVHTTKKVGIGTTNTRFALEVGAVGASGTTLYVNGDARITGILSVGQGTVTINGNNNTITAENIVVSNSISGNGVSGFLTAANLVGYATEGYVDNSVVGFITSGALSGYATEGYVDGAVVGFITSGALSGYATEGYVDGAVVGFITSGALSGYATETFVSNALVGYATEGYVDSAVASGGGGGESYWSQTAAGIHTLSNVGIGTTNPTSALTVLGSANISGVLTATSFFSENIVAGTLSATNVTVRPGNVNVLDGNVYFSTTDKEVGWIDGNGILRVLDVGSSLSITGGNPGENMGVFTQGGSAELYYNNNKKFETTGTGVTITGTTFTNQLSVSGNINSAGIITALSFVGDGSGLTNIVATGSGVEIRDNGTIVGTASTINFGDNLNVSAISAGVVTVTGAASQWITAATGIHTLSNVGVGTTNPQTPLQVENVYGVKTGSDTFTASAGIAYTADSYAASDFVNAEYTLFFQHSIGIQSQKVLVMDDGTTAYSQEYAIMSSSDLLVSVGATVKSGNVELWWTPETGVSGIITYRYTRETMI